MEVSEKLEDLDVTGTPSDAEAKDDLLSKHRAFASNPSPTTYMDIKTAESYLFANELSDFYEQYPSFKTHHDLKSDIWITLISNAERLKEDDPVGAARGPPLTGAARGPPLTGGGRRRRKSKKKKSKKRKSKKKKTRRRRTRRR